MERGEPVSDQPTVMRGKHEMQFADEPNWCIHCGTFGEFVDHYECTDDRTGQYDNRLPANKVRVMREFLGIEASR